MNNKVKEYIESNIDFIKSNNLEKFYLNCPLELLEDVIMTLQRAKIHAPEHLHNYIVVCCYMSKHHDDLHLAELHVNDFQEQYIFKTSSVMIPTPQHIYKDLKFLLHNKVTPQVSWKDDGFGPRKIQIVISR